MKDITEEILRTENTASSIGRVVPDEQLILRLKSIPVMASQVYHRIPKRVVWGAAASILLLIAINAFVLSRQTKVIEQESVSSYFSYLKQI